MRDKICLSVKQGHNELIFKSISHFQILYSIRNFRTSILWPVCNQRIRAENQEPMPKKPEISQANVAEIISESSSTRKKMGEKFSRKRVSIKAINWIRSFLFVRRIAKEKASLNGTHFSSLHVILINKNVITLDWPDIEAHLN